MSVMLFELAFPWPISSEASSVHNRPAFLSQQHLIKARQHSSMVLDRSMPCGGLTQTNYISAISRPASSGG